MEPPPEGIAQYRAVIYQLQGITDRQADRQTGRQGGSLAEQAGRGRNAIWKHSAPVARRGERNDKFRREQ